jgi:glycosyltransferase involved in cell wall biosynthesis
VAANKIMPTIRILSGNHLCTNPRVVKEASALAEAGYDVEVHGGWFDPTLVDRDKGLLARSKFRFLPAYDLTENPALRLALRIRGRLANFFRQWTGRESHWQLGYFVSRLTQVATRNDDCLVIAHSEQALYAAAQALKHGLRAAVDMEDWYSEDLPLESRNQRPIRLLKRLECWLLREGSHATCTSLAMRHGLVEQSNGRPPTVIYNAFPWADRSKLDGQRKDRRDSKLPSVHWFSQTLGTDRGLGDLLDALPFMKYPFEIHLRGKQVPGFQEWLASKAPQAWLKNIFISPVVTNDELLSRISEHDVGFAGETKHVRSRDLTVTNKILQYLLGGLAVLASDTCGQKEVAESSHGGVRLYRSGDPLALANEINLILASKDVLPETKAKALKAAEKSFCWEHQVPKLLEVVTSDFVAKQERPMTRVSSNQ